MLDAGIRQVIAYAGYGTGLRYPCSSGGHRICVLIPVHEVHHIIFGIQYGYRYCLGRVGEVTRRYGRTGELIQYISCLLYTSDAADE